MAEPIKPAALVQREEIDHLKNDVSSIKEMLQKIMQAEDGRSRFSRDQESREMEAVHDQYDDEWEESTLLGNPALKARPGFRQMWVRTEIAGEPDGSNVARMMNRGWRPRLASTLNPDVAGSCTVKFDGKETIGWRGTVLCEINEETYERFKRSREQVSQLQIRSVDENMFRAHDSSQRGFGAPHFVARNRTVETGRPAPVDMG